MKQRALILWSPMFVLMLILLLLSSGVQNRREASVLQRYSARIGSEKIVETTSKTAVSEPADDSEKIAGESQNADSRTASVKKDKPIPAFQIWRRYFS